MISRLFPTSAAGRITFLAQLPIVLIMLFIFHTAPSLRRHVPDVLYVLWFPFSSATSTFRSSHKVTGARLTEAAPARSPNALGSYHTQYRAYGSPVHPGFRLYIHRHRFGLPLNRFFPPSVDQRVHRGVHRSFDRLHDLKRRPDSPRGRKAVNKKRPDNGAL